MHPHRAALLLAIAVTLLAACGKDEKKTESEPQKAARHVSSFTRQSVPELGRLVPADAVAVVVFAPRAQLGPKLDRFLTSVVGRKKPLLDQLLAQAGTSPADVDPDRPIAVALTLGEQNRPQPTFILPAKGGDYVAKGHAPPAAATPPPLARDLPGGDVAFRVDLARLVPAVRPALEPYLSADGLVGLDPALSSNPNSLAMLDAMAGGARTLIDSAERIEGTLGLDGGKVDLNVALTVKEGSALDTPPVKGGAPLLDLAKSIDAKHCAMTMLARIDFSSWMAALTPLMRSMYGRLPDGEAHLQRYLKVYGKMYEAMGPSFAAGADFGADGMRMVGAMQPEDGAAYLARYREAIVVGSAPELGVTITLGEPLEVDGVTLDVYRVAMDWNKLMAAGAAAPPGVDEITQTVLDTMFPDGIQYAQGVVGDYVIMAGPSGAFKDAVATAKARSGGLPPAVAAAVEPDTMFLVHVDMRRMFTGVFALMRKAMPDQHVPTVPAGPPADFWLRTGQTGRTYSITLHADAGGMATLFH